MTYETRQQHGVELFDFSKRLTRAHQAFFTTRIGGVSTGNYQSLNLSYSSGDARPAVAENWQRLLTGLPNKARLLFAHQVHGTDIFVDDGVRRDNIGEYDGLISCCDDVWLMTFHADCLPVYMSVRGSNWFGLAHSGWRGTLAGIAPKLAKVLLAKSSAERSDLAIVIGPGISASHYAVGQEVYQQFSTCYGDTTAYRMGQSFVVDLAQAIVESLVAIDISVNQIYSSRICTFERRELCYSYRRQGPQSGRMAAVIGRNCNYES